MEWETNCNLQWYFYDFLHPSKETKFKLKFFCKNPKNQHRESVIHTYVTTKPILAIGYRPFWFIFSSKREKCSWATMPNYTIFHCLEVEMKRNKPDAMIKRTRKASLREVFSIFVLDSVWVGIGVKGWGPFYRQVIFNAFLSVNCVGFWNS